MDPVNAFCGVMVLVLVTALALALTGVISW
jgi:hypothetical protein